MSIATLTASIAALPDRTRHIVASVVASRMAKDGDKSWRPIWDMSRDHEADHEWISGEELRGGLVDLGIAADVVEDAVKSYTAHSDHPTAGIGRQDGYNRPQGTQAKSEKVDTKYEWSGSADVYSYEN